MKIGAMNNPRANIYKEIEWIAKNGFDFIDLTLEPTASLHSQVDIKKVKAHINKHGLGVVGHMGDWALPKESHFPALREVSKQEIINTMRALAAAGAKKITTHSFERKRTKYKIAEKYCYELYKDLVKEAKRLGVTLMVENGGIDYAYNLDNRRLYASTLKRFPELKVHIDVGHANIGVKKNTVGQFFKKYSKRIVHIHFSDNRGKKDSHLRFGSGTVKWKEVIKTLKRYGYDSTITVETFRSGRKGEKESMKKLRRWWAAY
jgi:sugar phosphate isomerase/epimerase